MDSPLKSPRGWQWMMPRDTVRIHSLFPQCPSRARMSSLLLIVWKFLRAVPAVVILVAFTACEHWGLMTASVGTQTLAFPLLFGVTWDTWFDFGRPKE